MPYLQLRRAGREPFVASILRNYSKSPSQLQYQPALKITPVGLFTFLCSQNYLRTLGICSIFAMPTVRLPLAHHGPESWPSIIRNTRLSVPRVPAKHSHLDYNPLKLPNYSGPRYRHSPCTLLSSDAGATCLPLTLHNRYFKALLVYPFAVCRQR